MSGMGRPVNYASELFVFPALLKQLWLRIEMTFPKVKTTGAYIDVLPQLPAPYSKNEVFSKLPSFHTILLEEILEAFPPQGRMLWICYPKIKCLQRLDMHF